MGFASASPILQGMMHVLTIDAALGSCSVALVADDTLIAARHADGGRGHAELAPMVRSVMADARLNLIAVTTGPGSFTGLRAALALAQGLGLGAGVPIVGVSVVEALADETKMQIGHRALWVAIDSRRGRVFLHHDGRLETAALEALPSPLGAVAIAGDAADEVAARLTASGYDAIVTGARVPLPRHIAEVGRQRAAGLLAPIALLPIYVDPPEVRQTPLRPPPT
jgi:tRNA threonylcarbamoyladenosine biosynthesis protein TsaB